MQTDEVRTAHRVNDAGRTSRPRTAALAALLVAVGLTAYALAQGGPGFPGGGQGGAPGGGFQGGAPGGGFQGGAPGGGFQGAPGGGAFPGDAGGPGGGDRLELVERFDVDGDGFLDAAERSAAKTYLQESGFNARDRGPGGGRGGGGTTGSVGVTLTQDDVESYAGASFYDPTVVRTVFVETGFDDWEAEMAAFYNTDVELPVTVTIDGVTYENVGMRFRGNSSFSMVSAGLKRPIRIKLDTVVDGQNVEGVRTIKLLNGINDPSYLRTALVATIMGDYLAAPRVNYLRLVVNGENWGLYQNQQHFNTDFLRDHLGESGGVRWEVPGSPNGRGGMVYLGDDPDLYRSVYEIDNKDTAASWAALIELFRVLDETPGDELVEALEPILDIEGTLRFLALDVALVNSDGFWTRASDCELYLDEHGRFHIIPHDLNEALSVGGGRGGGGGGGSSVTLDPLVGLTDASKPLRSKLLAVPELRKRYLEIVLDVAERWLDWDALGPIATDLYDLIDEDMARDTRKLYSYQQFEAALDSGAASVRGFVEQRGEYLRATVPALIDAIPVAAYTAPDPAAGAGPAQADQPTAEATGQAGAAPYAHRSGPVGWYLTAGSGRVVTVPSAEEGSPLAAFAFDALSTGFGDNKLDQCVAIDASQAVSIALQVRADAADAEGLAVRINPNFYDTLTACEAAMATDSGGDRLTGGRNDDDIDFTFGRADGGVWRVLDEGSLPGLHYAAADIPGDARYLRLSLRARDRSDSGGSADVLLSGVSVTQGGVELVVNGSFMLP